MRSTIIRGIAYAAAFATIASPLAASARCFSRWYYPWRQNCGVYARSSQVRFDDHHPVRPISAGPSTVVDIPLPDMSATWGGAMDSELELELFRLKAMRQLAE